MNSRLSTGIFRFLILDPMARGSFRKNLTNEVHELSLRDIETSPEGAGDRSRGTVDGQAFQRPEPVTEVAVQEKLLHPVQWLVSKHVLPPTYLFCRFYVSSHVQLDT